MCICMYMAVFIVKQSSTKIMAHIMVLKLVFFRKLNILVLDRNFLTDFLNINKKKR